MLDPNTARFQHSDFPGEKVYIITGTLFATQALTIDREALHAAENPDELKRQARESLRVMLWKQIYGQPGGIVKHLLAMANEAGDLRYLSPLKDLWALFNPQVQTPALESNSPEIEGIKTEPIHEQGVLRPANFSFEAINAFVHHEDVSFTDLQGALLSLAAHLNLKANP